METNTFRSHAARYLLFLGIVVSIFAFLFFFVHSVSAEDESSSISGYVFDKETEEPLPNVWIYVQNENGSYSNSTSSNETGYYYLNIPSGKLTLEVWYADYFSYKYNFKAQEDQHLQHNIYLKPKPERNSTLYGYVKNKETGEGIANLNLSVMEKEREDEWNGTTTNDTGYYLINVSFGEITLEIWDEGYRSYTEKIEIEMNSTIQHDIYLEPKPPENSLIYGYVYEKNSSRGEEKPLKEALVSIYNMDYDDYNQTTTDKNGYFEMWCAEGNISFEVYIQGYDRYREMIYINEGEEKEIRVYMIPQNTIIYGYVYEKAKGRDETPVKDVYINIYNRDTENWNFTMTDEEGYYEMWVAEGNLDLHADAKGYFHYYDNFYAEARGEYEKVIYLEPKPPENSLIYGYVYDNVTGKKIGGALLRFHNIDYDQWNETKSQEVENKGYYEINVFKGSWVLEVEKEGYASYTKELTVDENQEYALDIYLKPIPPPDSLIKGYLKDEEGEPIKGMVFTNSLTDFGEIENGTQTEDDGYFEVGVYGGAMMIAAMDLNKDYYFFAHLTVMDKNSVNWYNITLYGKREDTALVMGYVKDQEGKPLEGAWVRLAGSHIGIQLDEGDEANWPYMAKTDESGYYKFTAPPSALSRGEEELYYLYVDYNESHGAVREVTLEEGENYYNFTLKKPEVPREVNIYLNDDWNTGFVKFEEPFKFVGSWKSTRLIVDFIMGNRDGYVDEDEEEVFLAFLNSTMKRNKEDEGPDEMKDTIDNFYVDDIYYIFEQGFFTSMEFSNVMGEVDNKTLVTHKIDINFTAHEPIEEATVHHILLNISYPEDQKEVPESFVLYLPMGFTLFMAEYTENVSVKVDALLPNVLRLKYVGNVTGPDLWEWVNITVASKLMGYIKRTDEPGSNLTIEGNSVSFEAFYINPEGLNIVGTVWDFGAGQCCENDLKPSYIWSDNGEFEVKFIVVTDTAEYILDSMVINVMNAVPEVDAGENVTDAVAGFEVGLEGSFIDKGMEDSHTILWEAIGAGNNNVVLLDPESLTTGVVFKKGGNYQLRLTVTDDDGGTGSDTLFVTVINTAPWPRFDEIQENDVLYGVVNIKVSDGSEAKDIKLAKLEYSIDGVNWASIGVDNTPEDGFVVIWNTLSLQDGEYHLRLTLEDFSGSTNTTTLTVEINNSIPPMLEDVRIEVMEEKTILTWTLPGSGGITFTPKFARYKIYRSETEFHNVDGMSPLATIEDIAERSYRIEGIEPGAVYYYAVTIEDLLGNENTTVTSVKYEAMMISLKEVSFSKKEPDANYPLKISAEIENTGGDYARNITVEIYVDDELKDTIGPFNIAPNAVVSKTGEWTTEKGDHTIKVVVVYGEGMTEEKTLEITVGAGGDTPGFELPSLVIALIIGTAFVFLFRRKR